MKKYLYLLLFFNLSAFASDDELNKSLHKIVNFHFVSEQMASSGMLDLKQYKHILEYDFKHVINLIPGNQIKERKHVQSLGLSYEQIAVDWGNPTAKNFADFTQLIKSYGDEKIYIHCEMNMRASAFVYLYRVLYQGVETATAEKDMLKIWQPKGTWQQFIETTITNKS